MPFIVAPVDQVKVTIEIDVPGDFGEISKQDMDVTFKKPNVQERKDIFTNVEPGTDDRDVLRPNIITVDGLKDPNGKDVKCSPKVISELLNMEYVLIAMRQAFQAIAMGGEAYKELKRKN